MSDSMTAQLVTDALLMAIWRRGKPDALLHHSDQGSQGGFNRRSQRFELEASDGYPKATIEPVHTITTAVAGEAPGRQSA